MWTAEKVCRTLGEAGIVVAADDVRVEPRGGVTVATLRGKCLAWFADDEKGRRRLAVERRVLRLLEAHCSFLAPRIVHESTDGTFDVRAPVPGVCDPQAVFERASADPQLAARLGQQLATILADQHTRLFATDAATWLPRRPAWPEPGDWIRERLPRVTDDRSLVEAVSRLLARYDAVVVDDADRVLVHGDFGFHNVAFEPDTLRVRGVFDYGDAAWWDRHHDFRYLLFDVDRDEMLDAALAVYEPLVGRTLCRRRIALYNAVSAASFLAFRLGVAPETRCCGRTLEQDLAWTRKAVARAEPAGGAT
jgi:aminoglycoside phosphotransferase (APT) family kinase protein